jgi:hypothetical protein
MKRSSRIGLISTGVLFAAIAILGYSQPRAVACALMPLAPLDTLEDGSFVPPSMSVSARARAIQLRREALARISDRFGQPYSRPWVIYLDDSRDLAPFQFDPYAGTEFLGSRACVVIGPLGRSTDVVADELVHAELQWRVGFWGRLTKIPTWFDEGLAMQVDDRPNYDLPNATQAEEMDLARSLDTRSKFFAGSDEQLTHHYALAKAEVTQWVARVGSSKVYQRLERIKQGDSFDAILHSD